MPILYAVVARGASILASHAITTGNFETITPLILEKVDSTTAAKKSYAYQEHVFHYLVDSGLTFLCMAQDDTQRRMAFAFLVDVAQRFLDSHGEAAAEANAYAMDATFKPVLKARMHYFNTDPQADRIKHVQSQVADVREIMVDNIDKILERGDRIELLVEKTDHLAGQAEGFQKRSRKVRRKMYWRNKKWTAILVCMVLLVIFVLLLGICGITFQRCRSSDGGGGGGGGGSGA